MCVTHFNKWHKNGVIMICQQDSLASRCVGSFTFGHFNRWLVHIILCCVRVYHSSRLFARNVLACVCIVVLLIISTTKLRITP
jgi:hypothetical protein